MKYTNYIIQGQFIDIDSIISSTPIIKEITIIIAIVIAIIGILLIIGILPMSLTMDSMRSIRFKYYFLVKRMKKLHYINDIISSLDTPSTKQGQYKMLLLSI